MFFAPIYLLHEILVLFIATHKIFRLGRIVSWVAKYLRLSQGVFNDAGPFIVFYVVWVIIIGITYKILHTNVTNKNEYPGVNEII